jgi:hypothetical protein
MQYLIPVSLGYLRRVPPHPPTKVLSTSPQGRESFREAPASIGRAGGTKNNQKQGGDRGKAIETHLEIISALSYNETTIARLPPE